MDRRQPPEAVVDARVALAKARLALLAEEAGLAPGATDRVAALVRSRPWRGVAVALGIGLTLGLTRGRGLRTIGTLVGPLGAAVASNVLRQFTAGPPTPEAKLATKVAALRARAQVR